MLSWVVEWLIAGFDLCVTVIGSWIMEIINKLITGMFNGFFYMLDTGGGSTAWLSWRPTIFNSALTIAYMLTFCICVYGFLIENLDFHTYDGWDRVIRLLIRIVVVTIMISASESILRAGRDVIVGANQLIASKDTFFLPGAPYSSGSAIGTYGTYAVTYSFWPGTKPTSAAGLDINFSNDVTSPATSPTSAWASYTAMTSIGSMINAFSKSTDAALLKPTIGYPTELSSNPLLLAASGTANLVLLGLFNAKNFILSLWTAVTHLIGILAIIILSVLILKKAFKIALNIAVPFLEFNILASLCPIGLSFYASHSTQHVGQSYVRSFIKTGLQAGFKILVLGAVGILGAGIVGRLDPAGMLSGDPMTHLNYLTCGHANDIILLFTSLVSISLAELAIERTDQLAGKVFGN